MCATAAYLHTKVGTALRCAVTWQVYVTVSKLHYFFKKENPLWKAVDLITGIEGKGLLMSLTMGSFSWVKDIGQ